MSDDFFEKVGSESVTRQPAREPAYMEPHEEVAVQVSGSRSWTESDGRFWGAPQSHKQLPVGVYHITRSPSVGLVFVRQQNDTDQLIELPDTESSKILDEIRRFKTLRPKFEEHGFLYKRGIMLWGPPGGGKTCTLQLLLKFLMAEHNSVALLVERPELAATAMQDFSRIEPGRQVIAIMEDFDALCERYGQSEYLSLLDGESQINNVIFLATTNYPERIDRRFVDRPSRFDTIRYVGMPTDNARRVYLQKKLPTMPPEELAEYVSASKGYSIAHLREMIILTHCFGVPLAQAAERINASRGAKRSSEHEPGKVFGFHNAAAN